MAKLTKRLVDSLAPKSLHYVAWDDEIKGFGVRVMPSGHKSYLFRYRSPTKDCKVKIGVHGQITVDQARIMARKLSGQVAMGENPAKEKSKSRSLPTMQMLVKDYLERHAVKKRPRSRKEDEALIRRFVTPYFGNTAVSDVTRRDIETLHLKLLSTPYQANRLLALLSKMFNLAINWNWRNDNPVKGVERYQELKRDRWLDEDELNRLLTALEEMPPCPSADAIKLLLLTGARRGEVVFATWEQFALQLGLWSKQAHMTKQKKTDHLPISQEAITLLEQLSAQSTHDVLVCPPATKADPLNALDWFWRKLVKKAGIKDVRLHDLRHTYASHLVSQGEPLFTVGKLLGHSQYTTTQRYAHLANAPLRKTTNVFGDTVKRIKEQS